MALSHPARPAVTVFLYAAQVYILHHTDCGMLTFDNDTIHKKIKEDLGADASHIDFLPFG